MSAARTAVELRVYLPIPDLGRQFAAYLGTPLRARGYPPIEGDHALIVEVAPGLAIERIIDLALKSVPDIEPGIHFVERQFGVLEVHAADPALVEQAGEAILDGHRRAARGRAAPAGPLRRRDRGGDRPARGDRQPQPRGVDAAARPDAARRRGDAGAVRGRRRQRRRAGGARADARHRLDDRRRRPRLSRRLDPGYRPRARRDHARPRGCEGTRPDEHRRACRGGAGPLRPVAGRDRDALQRLREPHLPRRGPRVGRRYALRVHRPGYRTAHQIESELQWVDALREDGAVDTCVPVPAPGGERVARDGRRAQRRAVGVAPGRASPTPRATR